jgi:hypothetical protein
MWKFNQLLPQFQALQTLQAAEEIVQARQSQYHDQFETQMQAARSCLRRLNSGSTESTTLQTAVEHLLTAASLQRSRYEPYVWLAYAMAVAKALPLFSQYLQMARELGAPAELLAAFSRKA